MSDPVRPHRRQPTRLPRLGDSHGKNTGVGCHFLLQCVKVNYAILNAQKMSWQYFYILVTCCFHLSSSDSRSHFVGGVALHAGWIHSPVQAFWRFDSSLLPWIRCYNGIHYSGHSGLLLQHCTVPLNLKKEEQINEKKHSEYTRHYSEMPSNHFENSDLKFYVLLNVR